MNTESNLDLGKVLQAGRLAKVSLYRSLLHNVASGAPLSAHEMRMLRDLGAELEELEKKQNQCAEAQTRTAFDQTTRSAMASHVFRVSAQTISKWVLKEGMPRNEDGTFSIADSVEWALERTVGANSSGKKGEGETDEATVWLTAFRRERALKAKMEREELEGKLFPREEVTAAWCNRYAHIKRHLLVWSKRLPGRLAGLNERAMISLLEEEVHFLLSMLSRPGTFTELAEDFEKRCKEENDHPIQEIIEED